MVDLARKVVEIELHQNAQDTAENYIKQFADVIILQSKNLASLDGTDEVQTVHVEKAREIILTISQRKNRWRDALIAGGGLGLGIAFQGIIAEYSMAQPRQGYFVFYFVLGVISAGLFVLGILKN